MVFEEKDYSEALYARAMAEAVDAEHYERLITAQDVFKELGNILRAMDQPTIDGVNTYFVSRTAREAGLTVALSGLGGDELFGGYPNTFQGVPRLTKVLRIAQCIPGAAFLRRQVISKFTPRSRWNRVADAFNRPVSLASAYLTRRGLFSPSEVVALVKPEVWNAAMATFEPVEYVSERTEDQADLFRWVSQAELRVYTHNQLLRDTDVMSMAHSLEVRVPLLDHRLIEAVLRLPEWVQRNGKGPKALLIDAFESALPPLIRERRDKMGFSFPFGVWLQGPLAPLLEEAIREDSGRFKGLLRSADHRFVQAYKSKHWAPIWALVVLKMWDRCSP